MMLPRKERRTLAVQARRYMSVEEAGEIGMLDPAAIARVKKEAWPDPRDPDEVHDALTLLGFVTETEARPWEAHLNRLVEQSRATKVQIGTGALWICAERLAELTMACPGAVQQATLKSFPPPASREDALRELMRSRLEGLGPVRESELGEPLGLETLDLRFALQALETEGFAMQGHFLGVDEVEWWR